MNPREALEATIRYLSEPERMHETQDMRHGLRELLADLPRTAPIPYPTKAYQNRRIIHRAPQEIWDEA